MLAFYICMLEQTRCRCVYLSRKQALDTEIYKLTYKPVLQSQNTQSCHVILYMYRISLNERLIQPLMCPSARLTHGAQTRLII